MNCLKNVEISFKGSITNENLGVKLMDGFSSFSHLISLKIDVSECENISDNTLMAINYSIEKYKMLETLEIIWNNSGKCRSSTYSVFFYSLMNFKNLKKLSLQFENCGNFSDGNFKTLAEALKPLNELSELKLLAKTEQYAISFQAIDAIASSIEKLTLLKKVQLDFNFTKLNEMELIPIVKKVSSVKDLNL